MTDEFKLYLFPANIRILKLRFCLKYIIDKNDHISFQECFLNGYLNNRSIFPTSNLAFLFFFVVQGSNPSKSCLVFVTKKGEKIFDNNIIRVPSFKKWYGNNRFNRHYMYTFVMHHVNWLPLKMVKIGWQLHWTRTNSKVNHKRNTNLTCPYSFNFYFIKEVKKIKMLIAIIL